MIKQYLSGVLKGLKELIGEVPKPIKQYGTFFPPPPQLPIKKELEVIYQLVDKGNLIEAATRLGRLDIRFAEEDVRTPERGGILANLAYEDSDSDLQLLFDDRNFSQAQQVAFNQYYSKINESIAEQIAERPRKGWHTIKEPNFFNKLLSSYRQLTIALTLKTIKEPLPTYRYKEEDYQFNAPDAPKFEEIEDTNERRNAEDKYIRTGPQFKILVKDEVASLDRSLKFEKLADSQGEGIAPAVTDFNRGGYQFGDKAFITEEKFNLKIKSSAAEEKEKIKSKYTVFEDEAALAKGVQLFFGGDNEISRFVLKEGGQKLDTYIGNEVLQILQNKEGQPMNPELPKFFVHYTKVSESNYELSINMKYYAVKAYHSVEGHPINIMDLSIIDDRGQLNNIGVENFPTAGTERLDVHARTHPPVVEANLILRLSLDENQHLVRSMKDFSVQLNTEELILTPPSQADNKEVNKEHEQQDDNDNDSNLKLS